MLTRSKWDHKEMPTLLRFVQKYDKNCFCFWHPWDWVWRNRPTVTCFWSAVLTWWSVTAFFLLPPSVSVVFVSSAFFLLLFFFPKPLQRQSMSLINVSQGQWCQRLFSLFSLFFYCDLLFTFVFFLFLHTVTQRFLLLEMITSTVIVFFHVSISPSVQ